MFTSRRMANCMFALALLAPTLVSAQSVTTPKSDTTTRSDRAKTDTVSSSVADVQNWTNKQWQAAKLEWSKDKVKWADCRAQADRQHLVGHKSWGFLYTCMAN